MEQTTKLVKSNSRNDLLKFIAVIAMIVDHIGSIFLPQFIFLRVIGRIAFPIFAASIAEGYQYTKNFDKYILRLLGFGIISQIPFAMLFEKNELNVMFTFVLALMLIFFLDRKNYFFAGAILVLVYFVDTNYGMYGVAMSAFFYFLRSKKIWLIISLCAITIWYCLYYSNVWQLFALGGFLAAMYLPRDLIKIKLPRYFFYWFYPVHIVILLILKQIL